MNDTANSTTVGTDATVTADALPTQAVSTIIEVVTTVAPSGTDSGVVAVVAVLIVLTLVALCFLLYRYLCHNKGDYRTTGEPAPGDDEDYSNQATEKKEYFI